MNPMDHMHNSQKGLIFIFCFWKIKKLKNDIFKPKIWWDKDFSSLKQEILFKYDGVNIILFSKVLWLSKLI